MNDSQNIPYFVAAVLATVISRLWQPGTQYLRLLGGRADLLTDAAKGGAAAAHGAAARAVGVGKQIAALSKYGQPDAVTKQGRTKLGVENTYLPDLFLKRYQKNQYSTRSEYRFVKHEVILPLFPRLPPIHTPVRRARPRGGAAADPCRSPDRLRAS